MDDFGFPSIGIFCAGLCAINFVSAYFLLPESIKQKRLDAQIKILPIADYKHVFGLKLMPYIMVIGFIYIAAFFLFQLPSSILWHDHFEFSKKEISYIFGFIGISTAIVQGGLIGVFTKWFGERKLMFMGNLMLALTVVIIPFIPKGYFIPFELIILFVLAVANGFVGPALLSIVSQLAPKNEQGVSLGIYQSFGALARAAGPILGGGLYAINYHVPYVVACVFYIGNTILVFLFLRKLVVRGGADDSSNTSNEQQTS